MALMKNFPRRLLLASAVSAWAASAAFALPIVSGGEFQVQEGSVPGTPADLVTANGISFSYKARIDQAANGSFTETGYLTKTAFTDANGATLPSYLNGIEPNGYGIYGVFTITGTAVANGAGGVTMTYNTFDLSLTADPILNTLFSTTGPVGGVGDDIPLLTMNLVSGRANIFGSLATGDFNALLNTSVTPFGAAFFVSPNPFYQFESFSGNTATITGLGLPGTAFTAQVSGSGVETFQAATPVPEPASLALLVSGLGGLGALCWRRKRKHAA